jgi:uncharacterized damage-inducible protein DinB
MSEVERILDQMDRAFSGDAWHGPPLKTVLEGLTAEDASNHAIADAHSIWELVLHITAWKIIVRHELTGEKVDVTPEIDWPPVWETSEIAWKRTVENLDESHKRLREAASGLREDQLEEKPAARTGNSRYVMLHGVVQHDLYHAGQMAVLKKAIRISRQVAHGTGWGIHG